MEGLVREGHAGVRRSAAGLAAALGAGYLVLAPQSPDLPAQVARAAADGRGAALWWAGWYGGINTSTYSLLSAHVMSLVGVGLVGVLATLAIAVLSADLVADSVRPRAGAAALTLSACANLYSGRITFAAGMAVVLASFCVLRRGRPRTAAALAAVSGLLSPLAALCEGVGLVALVLSSPPDRRRHLLVGHTLIAGAAVAPVGAVTLVFGQPSYMPFSADIVLLALLACAGLAVAPVPRQVRALALVSAVLALASALTHTPIGSNAARLPMLVAGPLVVAYARPGARWAWLLAPALLVWPLVSFSSDMTVAAQPSSQASFYTALLTHLPAAGTATQRLELVEPESQAAAYYASVQIPLARGWERQVDAADNPLFYDGTLSAQSYRSWLVDRGVGWVAVPRAKLDYGAIAEGALVARPLPYLHQVWADRDWQLFRVGVPAPVATGVLRTTALLDTGLLLTASGAGQSLVHVPYSRLLVLRSMDDPQVRGCVRPGSGPNSLVDVPGPGRYVLHAELASLREQCPDA